MSIESKIFERYTVDKAKLTKYGFIKNKDIYSFEKVFYEGKFKAVINISPDCVSGTVFDLENNDEFLPLKVENHQGAFTGEIRAEYEKILTGIRDNCFSANYFIFPQSNRITSQIYKKYGNPPEFLWEKYSGSAIFRNPDSKKWYGLIADIDKSKLEKDKKGRVEILNIKLDEEEIQTLLKQKGFYPAYHMNKKTWITITLDDTLTDKQIMKLIDESHGYTIKK